MDCKTGRLCVPTLWLSIKKLDICIFSCYLKGFRGNRDVSEKTDGVSVSKRYFSLLPAPLIYVILLNVRQLCEPLMKWFF